MLLQNLNAVAGMEQNVNMSESYYGPPTQTNNFAINVTFLDLCTKALQHCSKDCSSPSLASLYKTDYNPVCVFTSTQWNEGVIE